MNKAVKRVVFPEISRPKVLRTAAYCRVSSEKDSMHHSLSAQVSYYNDLIQKTPGWTFAGVFADEAKTGTKDSREGWQELLDKCWDGEVDQVITKSISRFSRNTLDFLSAVRELKEAGVDVYFEEQRIHSMSGEGELMLTILASFAQEESLSCSENQKWRIRKDFSEGKPWNGRMLGYRKVNGRLEIIPEEAETVRWIFSEYLNGKGFTAIAKELNGRGTSKQNDTPWKPNMISKLLNNIAYTGTLNLQQCFSENHLTKRRKTNNGELPRYVVEDAHEPIISRETFDLVKEERKRREAKFAKPDKPVRRDYLFTSLIRCPYCGAGYRRKTTATGIVWICSTYNTLGKSRCPLSKQIPEPALEAVTAEVLGTENTTGEDIKRQVERIEAKQENTLVFFLKNGSTATRQWKDRSRAESWTDEMKAAARKKTLERSSGKCLK